MDILQAHQKALEENSDLAGQLETAKPLSGASAEAVRIAARFTLTQAISQKALSVSDSDKVAPLFPAWAANEAVAVNDIRSFNGHIYTCVQAHTTQADWTPDVVPALWTPYRDPNAIAEWVQPTGAQDAYPKGAKVTHNGKTWQSNVDANVWEPGVSQWTEVIG